MKRQEKMRHLSIDVETFSSVDLKKAGVYKYAESEDFEILLFAYAVDGGDVQIVDFASGEHLPIEIVEAIKDDKIIKSAFNAQFERITLSKFLGLPNGTYLNPTSWRCTLVWSAYLGLPLSLETVGNVLGLEKQKLKEGKEYIKYFCMPCAPTKVNGGRSRNYFYHDKEKWEKFKYYNMRDVEVEMQIAKKLDRFQVPDFIWKEYHLDQTINDRGIKIDKDFVESALKVNESIKNTLMKEMIEITKVENANSVLQIRNWLASKGIEAEKLDKDSVSKLLKEVDEEATRVLMIRQQLSKSSVKKYDAMMNCACEDDRCRGMFQFLGASRTGRYGGRLVQLQNLPRNYMQDLSQARALVKQENHEAIRMLYEDIPNMLSQLIRTSFIPKENQSFYVVDFSAIEARVIAWLANEKWRLSLFKNGGDIYCESASKMFGVPVEKHGVNKELRQKGKISELACGYGGSVGALTAMGALDMGLKEEELKPLVDAWRQANPNIVALWWAVDACVKKTVQQRISTETHGIQFSYESGILFITLPSKRRLAYIKPKMTMNQFGSESVSYEGVGIAKKWERIESYGPKFVENIVQAISRDLLMFAMENLKDYRIVAHVHDEIIIEASKDIKLEEISRIMSIVPSWANGLQLDADGYVCEFYRKE